MAVQSHSLADESQDGTSASSGGGDTTTVPIINPERAPSAGGANVLAMDQQDETITVTAPEDTLDSQSQPTTPQAPNTIHGNLENLEAWISDNLVEITAHYNSTCRCHNANSVDLCPLQHSVGQDTEATRQEAHSLQRSGGLGTVTTGPSQAVEQGSGSNGTLGALKRAVQAVLDAQTVEVNMRLELNDLVRALGLMKTKPGLHLTDIEFVLGRLGGQHVLHEIVSNSERDTKARTASAI